LSIERLEEIKESLFDRYNARLGSYSDVLNIYKFMTATIDTFKHQFDQITELESKVETLEKAKTYYPTEEEIRNIKIGGTD